MHHAAGLTPQCLRRQPENGTGWLSETVTKFVPEQSKPIVLAIQWQQRLSDQTMKR